MTCRKLVPECCLQDMTCVFIFCPTDDKIYSLVTIDPSHQLGQYFHLSIEKVFLCTGQNGHLPRYEPSNGQYGCLGPAPQLLHSIKILVRWGAVVSTVGGGGRDRQRILRLLKWFMFYIFFINHSDNKLTSLHNLGSQNNCCGFQPMAVVMPFL